jgi:hypothetical protein
MPTDMDKINDLTKSYLPTISVVGIIGAICAVTWFAAVYSTRLETAESRIKSIEDKIATMPTRQEFTDLKNTMTTGFDKMDSKMSQIMTSLKIR